jgi:hypothetical protein
MLSVKGGGQGRNAYGRTKPPVKSVKEEPKVVKEKEDEDDLPRRIAVKRTPFLDCVPGNTWACPPFKWDPQAFALESDRLDQSKIIEAQAQDDSLSTFMKNPESPVIYGVCGNPNEVKAKLFAAHLLNIHCRHLGHKAKPVWNVQYGGYENRLLKEYSGIDSSYEPSILVLSNLAVNSTQQKLEKAKDLLERFSSIPRIVIAAGEDPISFLSSRLYVECNALAYFSESLVKKRIEVY